MSRSAAGRAPSGNGAHASSSAAGRNSSDAKLGESKLLRTRHIDTLEVLEEYAKERDRLQRENQALQAQLGKLNAMSGDPYARIDALEARLLDEQAATAQAQGCVAALERSLERHRAEATHRDTALRDASSAASALRAELHSQQETQAASVEERRALLEQVASLKLGHEEALSRAAAATKQGAEYKALLDAQNERVRALEIQLTLGPPLPLPSAPAPASSDAAEKDAGVGVDSSATLRALKAAQRKLRERDASVATMHEEAVSLRAQLAALQATAAQREEGMTKLQGEHKRAQAALAAAQQPQASSAAAADSARKKSGSKDELAKRKREWAVEKRELLAQLTAARKAATAAAATAAAAAALPPSAAAPTPAALPRPTQSEQELRDFVSQLQSEASSLRSQCQQLHEQNGSLRAEYAKVSAACNKMLAAHAASSSSSLSAVGGSKSGGSGGSSGGSSGSITIASKRAHFPEFVALKRENDALHTQVAELRQALHAMHAKWASGAGEGGASAVGGKRAGALATTAATAAVHAPAQAMVSAAQPASAASPAGSLARRRAQPSVASSAGSAAAHEPVISPRSARIPAANHSVHSSPSMAVSTIQSTTGGRARIGSAGRRASAGWPAAAAPLNTRK